MYNITYDENSSKEFIEFAQYINKMYSKERINDIIDHFDDLCQQQLIKKFDLVETDGIEYFCHIDGIVFSKNKISNVIRLRKPIPSNRKTPEKSYYSIWFNHITKYNRYITTRYYIHRIVCYLFKNPDHKSIEEFDNLTVDHLKGYKYDNRASQLEWCNQKENNKRAIKSGLKRCKPKKITVKDVIDNKKWAIKSLTECGNYFNTHLSVINQCIKKCNNDLNYLWRNRYRLFYINDKQDNLIVENFESLEKKQNKDFPYYYYLAKGIDIGNGIKSNVVSVAHGIPKLIKPSVGCDGYCHFSACNVTKKNNYKMHRFGYETWYGEIPENLVVNHIDENKLNNDINNLDLKTQQENVEHSRSKKVFVLLNNHAELTFDSYRKCSAYFCVDPSIIGRWISGKLKPCKKHNIKLIKDII